MPFVEDTATIKKWFQSNIRFVFEILNLGTTYYPEYAGVSFGQF